MTALYPLTLRLASRRVVVVGGGAVAVRRLPALVAADARVVVVDPQPSRTLEELAASAAGNVELLSGLRERRNSQGGLKLYFLSNMPAPFARALEQRHDFLSWFDGGIFSGDVKLGKPDPAIFNLLASRYRLDSAETLFIDDSLANVQAADALGWQTIHCEAPERLPAQLMNKLSW